MSNNLGFWDLHTEGWYFFLFGLSISFGFTTFVHQNLIHLGNYLIVNYCCMTFESTTKYHKALKDLMPYHLTCPCVIL